MSPSICCLTQSAENALYSNVLFLFKASNSLPMQRHFTEPQTDTAYYNDIWGI